MTKMAVLLIYVKKNFQFFVSEFEKPMTYKLGIQYWELWLYLIYSNDDSLWTLAYFTRRSI